jgi:LysR family transcriptional regulator, transcriptional activator for aaeXAB operon
MVRKLIFMLCMMPMISLTYPLSVLSKAVAFRNLSAASMHVGLSQPQLSRLVASLEAELEMELLDRRVKRNSTWTPQALRLAELFHDTNRRLDLSIRALQADHHAKQIHLASLEGLADQAISAARKLLEAQAVETVFLDIYDRSELEAKFLAGDTDIIVNTRVPRQAKPRFMKVLGYQSLDRIESPASPYELFSSYEYNKRARVKKRAPQEKATLVSNSLYVRRTWLEKIGGSGSLPSTLTDKNKKGLDEVLLIGGDWLEPRLWNILT